MTFSLPERTAPVIETERLRLRPHTVADFDACVGMWSDVDVTRFIGGRPQTREEVWARVLRYAGMWSMIGLGFWAVETKDGAFVGEVGVMDARRDMTPGFDGEPEIGWALTPAAHGKGYASEMVGAAVAWAGRSMPGAMLVCIISPENAASLKLAAKFGFRERLRTLYHGQLTIQMERPAR